MLLATLIAKVGVRCMDHKTGTDLFSNLPYTVMMCTSSVLLTGGRHLCLHTNLLLLPATTTATALSSLIPLSAAFHAHE